jgi:hypothetical protein
MPEGSSRGPKTLNCSWPGCRRTENRRSWLERHEKTHEVKSRSSEAPKDFSCLICGWQTNWKNKFQAHKKKCQQLPLSAPASQADQNFVPSQTTVQLYNPEGQALASREREASGHLSYTPSVLQPSSPLDIFGETASRLSSGESGGGFSQ